MLISDRAQVGQTHNGTIKFGLAAPGRRCPFARPTVWHIALLARQRHLPVAAPCSDVVQAACRPRRSYPVSAMRAVGSGAASEHAPEDASEAALRRDRRIRLKPLLSRPTRACQHSPTHYESSACSARPCCITGPLLLTSSIFLRPPTFRFAITASLSLSSITFFLFHLTRLLLSCYVRHLPPFGPTPNSPASHAFSGSSPFGRQPPFRRVAQYIRPPGKKLTGKHGGMAWLRPGTELGLT